MGTSSRSMRTSHRQPRAARPFSAGAAFPSPLSHGSDRPARGSRPCSQRCPLPGPRLRPASVQASGCRCEVRMLLDDVKSIVMAAVGEGYPVAVAERVHVEVPKHAPGDGPPRLHVFLNGPVGRREDIFTVTE